MQCTRTVTLASIFLEFCPLLFFMLKVLSRAYLVEYKSYQLETSYVDRSHGGQVQCTITVTLAFLVLKLLPFVNFHA